MDAQCASLIYQNFLHEIPLFHMENKQKKYNAPLYLCFIEFNEGGA